MSSFGILFSSDSFVEFYFLLIILYHHWPSFIPDYVLLLGVGTKFDLGVGTGPVPPPAGPASPQDPRYYHWPLGPHSCAQARQARHGPRPPQAHQGPRLLQVCPQQAQQGPRAILARRMAPAGQPPSGEDWRKGRIRMRRKILKGNLFSLYI